METTTTAEEFVVVMTQAAASSSSSSSSHCGGRTSQSDSAHLSFLRACQHGNFEEVERMLLLGSRRNDVDYGSSSSSSSSDVSVLLAQSDESGRQPFYMACMRGHLGIARQLLAAGADSCACNSDGVTPLCAAAFMGECAAVRFLVSQYPIVECYTHHHMLSQRPDHDH
jgi:hypothetical protein